MTKSFFDRAKFATVGIATALEMILKGIAEIKLCLMDSSDIKEMKNAIDKEVKTIPAVADKAVF